MATVEKFLLGTQVTVLSTELNSLANNVAAVSSVGGASGVFDCTIGAGGSDGYTLCDMELTVTFGSAPAANTAISVWFLAAEDGTNFETFTATGTATPPKARQPDVTFPLEAVTTQQIITRRVLAPWGKVKFLGKNDGTGVAFPASGSTIKFRPVTPEGV